LLKEAPEGFFDQSTTSGGLNGQFTLAEMPLELPLKVTCAHFTFKETMLPGLVGNLDMGSGFW